MVQGGGGGDGNVGGSRYGEDGNFHQVLSCSIHRGERQSTALCHPERVEI